MGAQRTVQSEAKSGTRHIKSVAPDLACSQNLYLLFIRDGQRAFENNNCGEEVGYPRLLKYNFVYSRVLSFVLYLYLRYLRLYFAIFRNSFVHSRNREFSLFKSINVIVFGKSNLASTRLPAVKRYMIKITTRKVVQVQILPNQAIKLKEMEPHESCRHYSI